MANATNVTPLQGGLPISSGNPLPVNLTVSESVVPVTGATYTMLNSSFGSLIVFNRGTSIAVTLPQAGTADAFAAGWWVDVLNIGVGTVTITPTTSLINGAATLVILTGQGGRIVSNATDYFVNAGVAGFPESATELAFLDGVTAGTVLASKAAVVDSNKDIADFRNLSGTNLKAGKDAVAGTVTIFPATTALGKTVLSAADNAGNTQTDITTALQAGARTYTVPDAGGSASFAMTLGTQTIGGIKTFSSAVKTSVNVGTANTGTTAVEYGDGYLHTSVLTVNTTLPAITGGAAQAVGKLLYTLPAGAEIINSSYFSLAITQTQAHINADTPVVGLGTVIGTGAVADLTTPATFQNISVGKAAANCTGTATVQTALATASPFAIVVAASGGAAHTIHANAAATWAASGDTGALLVGTVVLVWQFMA